MEISFGPSNKLEGGILILMPHNTLCVGAERLADNLAKGRKPQQAENVKTERCHVLVAWSLTMAALGVQGARKNKKLLK